MCQPPFRCADGPCWVPEAKCLSGSSLGHLLPTLQLSLLFVFFSDPYVRVTLKRKNKSIATEQTRKKKKVCYGITAWSICFLPDVLYHCRIIIIIITSLWCSLCTVVTPLSGDVNGAKIPKVWGRGG